MGKHDITGARGQKAFIGDGSRQMNSEAYTRQTKVKALLKASDTTHSTTTAAIYLQVVGCVYATYILCGLLLLVADINFLADE